MSAEVAETIARVRAWRDDRRRAGERVGFVPTMGALHEGHWRLIETARQRGDHVVVSIFVNPLQFDRTDDLERYPRTLDADLRICNDRGVELVFVPTVGEMYPVEPLCTLTVKRITDRLCGQFRPGHFDGVATVVTKLFDIVQPDIAYFGEKDAQQLAVIRRMVVDLNIPVDIVGVPTVREADGLALSSRNTRLAPAEREAARCIPRALGIAATVVATGETKAPAVVSRAEAEIAREPRARLEYAELRDPETLEEVSEVTAPALLALAVWVGGVRLIDNRVLVPGGTDR